MVERLINLLILFFIGPAMAATIPLDQEEKRWTAWREQVFIKLISIVGNILAMVFFSYFVSIVSQSLNKLLETKNTFWAYFEVIVIKLIMTIGACIATMKGASLFTSIVSKGIAHQEGTSMAETRRIMGSGLKAAGGALVAGSTLALGKGGLSKFNPFSKNSMFNGSGGGGGAGEAIKDALGGKGKAGATFSSKMNKLGKFGIGTALGVLAAKGLGKLGSTIKNSPLGKFISDKHQMKKLGKANANSQFRSNRAQKKLDKQMMKINKAKTKAEQRKNFMNNVLLKSQQKQAAKNSSKIASGKGKSVISL